MTKRKSVWVIFGGLGGICLAASILIALVISKGQNIGEYLCDQRDTIATLDLNNQRRIIFVADNCYENDSRPVYYEVKEAGRVVTPLTYIDSDNGNARHSYTTFYAEGGSLVAVLETTVTPTKIVIMQDFAVGESWPRLRDNEVSTDESVKQKWERVFDRLRRENPQLPKPEYFKP
jgi:hypothetical protein